MCNLNAKLVIQTSYFTYLITIWILQKLSKPVHGLRTQNIGKLKGGPQVLLNLKKKNMRTFLAISVLYFQFTEHAPGSPYIFVSSVGCFISLNRNPAVIFISPIEPLPLRRELWSFFKLLVMRKNIWWTQLKVHKSHLLIYVQVLCSALLWFVFCFVQFVPLYVCSLTRYHDR